MSSAVVVFDRINNAHTCHIQATLSYLCSFGSRQGSAKIRSPKILNYNQDSFKCVTSKGSKRKSLWLMAYVVTENFP